jgi:hypothetical protein
MIRIYETKKKDLQVFINYYFFLRSTKNDPSEVNGRYTIKAYIKGWIRSPSHKKGGLEGGKKKTENIWGKFQQSNNNWKGCTAKVSLKGRRKKKTTFSNNMPPSHTLWFSATTIQESM